MVSPVQFSLGNKVKPRVPTEEILKGLGTRERKKKYSGGG